MVVGVVEVGVGTVLLVVVDEVVVDGAAVVVVVDEGGAVVDGVGESCGPDGGVPSGAGVLNGTGAFGPPMTYTGVPLGISL